jgi:ABC-type bacteriocin/lantibiotic exporter with double-glycine peptidase domain
MQATSLSTLLAALAEFNGHSFDIFKLQDKFGTQQAPLADSKSVYSFVDDLTAKANSIQLGLLVNGMERAGFQAFIQELQYPVIVFLQENNQFLPVIISPDKKGHPSFLKIKAPSQTETFTADNHFAEHLFTFSDNAEEDKNGKILFLAAFPMESLVSPDETTIDEKPLTPVQRFLRLLGKEKKDIYYIYVYSILVGVISLTVPLGVQAIIGFVSSGTVFSSIYVLIILVVIGTLISGILQIVQVTLVENLQRKIFAQAAFEFAYRVPRIKAEALLKSYPPELMNRFFDILTIQKSLPKFLIDITAALLQILFGLILLGFYNASFILFGLFLLMLLVLMFYITGPRGLKTSLLESKYKYKVVHWLEEIARTLYSFKIAGNNNMSVSKMDYYVDNYLHYRKNHYKVLVLLMANSVAFKVLVTGALLVLGGFLVIDRQITLGQFVASEIVIILIIGAVEKLIVSMDVVYDLLTSVEKIGNVTDLPLEKEAGMKDFIKRYDKGLEIKVRDLKYKYPGSENFALKGIDFELAAGEHVCLTGPTDSGKNTFTKIISGILTDYQGMISVNGLSVKNLNIHNLRDAIKKNISVDDIFNATLLDNITMGKNVSLEEVTWAIEKVGLQDIINSLPNGLYTEITAGGKEFSESILYRINLARCILTKPKLLILNDFFQHFSKREKMKIISFLQAKEHSWTLLIISNDPLVMAACDRIAVMHQGWIVAHGSYQEMMQHPAFQDVVSDNMEGSYNFTNKELARNYDKRFNPQTPENGEWE